MLWVAMQTSVSVSILRQLSSEATIHNQEGVLKGEEKVSCSQLRGRRIDQGV